MRIEKIYCDVCKKELIKDGVRRIRSCPEYNFTDLCDDCYLKIDEILVELKNNIIQLKKSEKRLSNQIYGMTVKKQKNYIPINRLDLMTEKLRKEGYNSVDIIEKGKIKYSLDILYQLRFKLEGE